MDEKIYKKLQSPDGINELLSEDYLTRLRIDPIALETFIQNRHKDAIDALADISRLTLLLARTQADRFRVREREHFKNKERSYLHTDVILKNGFSWSANWRYGGYGINSKGKAFPSSKRLKVNADGNYSMTSFRNAQNWARSLAEDVETNYALLRAMSRTQRKIREAIYSSSEATKKYFDEQPEIYEFDDEERASVINGTEAIKRFNERFNE